MPIWLLMLLFRNVITRGSKEVCTSATIPGHMNMVHIQTAGQQLNLFGQHFG